MEEIEKNTIISDDEEDLENLRLAALQTLKKSTPVPVSDIRETQNFKQNYGGSNFGKRRRGYHGIRPLKNGQCRPKVRTSNLISIPVVGSTDLSENMVKSTDLDSAPKLILPQDRYCNSQLPEKSSSGRSSKFDRYDKSDSESDYEETSNQSETPPTKLERATSLEALMQELENEIQGSGTGEKAKAKVKKIKIAKSDETVPEIPIENNDVEKNVKKDTIEENKKQSQESNASISKVTPNEDSQKIRRNRSPVNTSKNRPLSPKKPRHKRRSCSPIYPQKYSPYVPPPSFPTSVPYFPYENVPYNPMPPLMPVVRNFPPVYVPTPVPTFGSAPLSPRSAQFVLQNQKIIEKRKMSPRRSYSRSLSPVSPLSHLSDRSLSPRPKKTSRRSSPDRRLSPSRRPYSPLRPVNSPDRIKSNSRHVSPNRNGKVGSRKLSPLMRDRLSPKRRSPLSPIRNNRPSARSPNDPKRGSNRSPKSSVYDRLGAKKGTKRSRSPSLEKEPSQVENEKPLDPVLEARKRKFESSDVPKEGIIKLNVKSEENEETPDEMAVMLEKERVDEGEEEELEEEEVVENEEEVLNTKIDDIFPEEEESDEENEGRFKSSSANNGRSVSIVPFSKLANGSTVVSRKQQQRKNELEKGRKVAVKKEEKRKDKQRRSDSEKKPEKNRSPLHVQNDKNNAASLVPSENTRKENSSKTTSSSSVSKSVLKSRILLKGGVVGKTERKATTPVSAILENKKIEIKIRNPSKYEGAGQSYDVPNKDQLEEREKKEKRNNCRKVVAETTIKEDLAVLDEPEPEIIVDFEQNDDEEEEDLLNKKSAGDLRAQLSRKRAERQKVPLESVQSRLLHNALEGAVYKKDKKSKSKKKSKESAPKEGKLPIHMRLGIPKDEIKPKRKRSKNRQNVDQV